MPFGVRVRAPAVAMKDSSARGDRPFMAGLCRIVGNSKTSARQQRPFASLHEQRMVVTSSVQRFCNTFQAPPMSPNTSQAFVFYVVTFVRRSSGNLRKFGSRKSSKSINAFCRATSRGRA